MDSERPEIKKSFRMTGEMKAIGKAGENDLAVHEPTRAARVPTSKSAEEGHTHKKDKNEGLDLPVTK